MTVSIEHIDKAMAGTRDIVMLLPILQCVGDKEIAVDILDAEGA
jgi:hypothetical protein